MILRFEEFFSLMLIRHIKSPSLNKTGEVIPSLPFSVPVSYNFFDQIKQQIGQTFGSVHYLFCNQLNFSCFCTCRISLQKKLKELYERFRNLLGTNFTLTQ